MNDNNYFNIVTFWWYNCNRMIFQQIYSILFFILRFSKCSYCPVRSTSITTCKMIYSVYICLNLTSISYAESLQMKCNSGQNDENKFFSSMKLKFDLFAIPIAGRTTTWFNIRQWQWIQANSASCIRIWMDKFKNHQI